MRNAPRSGIAVVPGRLPSRDWLIEFLGRSHDLVPGGSESKALGSWIDQFAHYRMSG